MKTNMGTVDRTIRILVAIVLGIAAFKGVITGGWAIAASVVAGVFIFTSVMGFCPLYKLVGIESCPRKA